MNHAQVIHRHAHHILHQLAAELPGWTAGDILAATEGEAPDARDP